MVEYTGVMNDEPGCNCDKPMVKVTVETHKPEKYLLIDRETGAQWEIRDGKWMRAQAYVAEHEVPLVTNSISGLITGTTAASLAGVHPNTIRNWADRGMLTPTVLPSGVRRYNADQVKRATNKGADTGGDFMQGLGVDPI